MYTIYLHRNTVNGKFYIGLTNKTIHERFIEHCQWASRGSHFKFHNAIRKHGATCWTSETLATCETHEEAKFLEIEFIKEHDAIGRGYNMTAGGDGFQSLKRTAKHRAAIGRAHKGKVISEETREKLRQYKGEKASFYGRKHSKKWHQIMDEVRASNYRAKYRGENAKLAKEYIITFPDGHEEIIKGLTDFCRKRLINPSGMARVAQGNCDAFEGFRIRHVDSTLAKIADERRAARHERRVKNWKAGGKKAGEKQRKITDEQIAELKAAYADGAGVYNGFWTYWARKLGVSDGTIRNHTLGKPSVRYSQVEVAA